MSITNNKNITNNNKLKQEDKASLNINFKEDLQENIIQSPAFIKDGNYYILDKHPNELLEHFVDRGIFIQNTKPNTIDDYKLAVDNTFTYIYNKYYNSQY